LVLQKYDNLFLKQAIAFKNRLKVKKSVIEAREWGFSSVVVLAKQAVEHRHQGGRVAK